MAFLERGDASLHYEHHASEAGADAPLILFTHAYGAAMEMWRGQLEAVLPTHQAIIWDLRGHGRTKAESFHHDEALADMAALIDKAPDGQAVLCGLSLGGYLSQLFTIRNPEKARALVLADTGPGFRKDAARAQWNDVAERQARVLEKRGLGAKPDAPGNETHQSAEGLAAAARGLLKQSDGEVMEHLGGITQPALVVVGSDDKPFIGAVDYMAIKLSNAEKHVIEGAGHFANCDNPAAFNGVLRAFLDRL